jgi:penicillin-binding protein 1B
MTAGDQRNFFQKLFGLGPKPQAPVPVSNPGQPQVAQTPSSAPPGPPAQAATTSPEDEAKKKKGFFGKLFGAIKGDNKDKEPQSSPASPTPR